jgi:galactose oxidase
MPLLRNALIATLAYNVVSALPTLQERQSQQFSTGTFIAQCPGTETVHTASNGARYRICSASDYTGASATVINGITSANTCAARCSTTSGCVKAVWDRISNVCHIKAAEPAASLFWVVNDRFQAIRREIKPDPAVKGQWSDLVRFGLVPVAAYVVPSFPQPDRLLVFSAFGNFTFSGPTGKTQFGDYNFATGAISHREVANTRHDMFCPGISQLEDGRILIQGGADAEAVSIYNPSTNAFTRGPNMVIARGYQTSTILSNGKVFTIGGAYSGPRQGKNGEVFDPVSNTWTYLPDANVAPMLTSDREGIWREDNHAWLFGWKNGSVFQAGPSIFQHWYGTAGAGSVLRAGTRDSDDAMCGIFVMYDATRGKILSAGGSPDYTNSAANQRAHITTIGDPNTPSSIERVADMGFPRGYANAVVLPDGTVLVTGGQRRSMVFTNTDGILIAELFNPATKRWTQLEPEAVPRNYHSVSILLPDATVFSGGGGLCWVSSPTASSANCDRTVNHPDGQIFSPPYLFNSDGTRRARPVISALSATSVKAGSTLIFTASGSPTSFSLIRMGSVTHSVNSDQRRIPLESFTVSGESVTVQLPNDYGILLPGFYYLFAISSQGTPSVARTVQVIL